MCYCYCQYTLDNRNIISTFADFLLISASELVSWMPCNSSYCRQRAVLAKAYLHTLGPDELMGAGVPQADVSVVTTGEEVGLPGMDSQTPQLICVTLWGRSRGLYFIMSSTL